MKSILVAALLLISAGVSRADSVWTYTGNSTNLYSMDPFAAPAPNPCGCAMTGTVTLANAWTPVIWDFTAGNQSFTTQNSTLSAYLGLDDSRPTFFWSFQFRGLDGSFLSSVFWARLTTLTIKARTCLWAPILEHGLKLSLRPSLERLYC